MNEERMTIFHYDDGKEKYQSHEVFLRINEDAVYELDLEVIAGYGVTEEEALEKFKQNFRKALDEYEDAYKALASGEIKPKTFIPR